MDETPVFNEEFLAAMHNVAYNGSELDTYLATNLTQHTDSLIPLAVNALLSYQDQWAMPDDVHFRIRKYDNHTRSVSICYSRCTQDVFTNMVSGLALLLASLGEEGSNEMASTWLSMPRWWHVRANDNRYIKHGDMGHKIDWALYSVGRAWLESGMSGYAADYMRIVNHTGDQHMDEHLMPMMDRLKDSMLAWQSKFLTTAA